MVFGPLGLSFAPQIRSSRSLMRWIKPLANWYADAAGYRKLGLKYDDLLVEERDDVQKALKRLTPRQAYDRAYRLKLASQASVKHAPLPKEQWVPATEDVRYLKPLVVDVAAEDAERQKWDNMTIEKK